MAGRAPRTAGTHVTAVIAHLQRSMGEKEPDHWESAGLCGFLWEEAISTALRNQHLRGEGKDLGLVVPGELEEDGLLLTPDDMAWGEGGAVYEYKFTWKSYRKSPPESIWKYMVQLKAYCYVLRQFVGNLVVLYCCGNYGPPSPIGPVGVSFLFSPQELVDNWHMIRQGAADMERIKEKAGEQKTVVDKGMNDRYMKGRMQ